MKTMLMLCLYFIAFEATAKTAYYSQSSIEKFENENISPQELSAEIFKISEDTHNITLSYDEARRIMFGDLFLEKNGTNKYSVKDVYCNITIDETHGAGPNRIPNPQFLNCEHTWPQSKFSKQFPVNLQKGDLHHLFPSDMKANSTRNNHPFADVNGRITHRDCPDSQIGTSLSNASQKSFEPPVEHKGNVARAIYYFSTRYKMDIAPSESRYLKYWNTEDPVDAEERVRNDKIMKAQGNRNPFIDYPELINRL